MGLFDAFRRTPTTGAVTSFGRGHFAAQRIDIGVRPDKLTRRGVSHPRSPEAWAAYRGIGEVGFVVDFFANQLRRVRLYPAVETDDPKDGRVHINPDDPDLLRDLQISPEVAAQAAVELGRVRGENGSLGEILADMAVAYKVPGDGNLVATVDDEHGEVWQVLSSRALVSHQGRWVIRRTEGDKGTPLNPATDFIGRFWRRDPEWPGRAFSDLTRILDHAEGLQLISQSMRNASRSRTAGAGALFFDAAADLGGKGNKGTGAIRDADFYDDLQEYLAAPIRDPGSVAAFAPFVADINVPGDKSVADMMHLQTFDRPLTEIEIKREETLIHRIAFGLDAPPELITGYASLNHWTAWMVKDETYQAHIEPLAMRIADTIATLVVRPALRAAGVPAPIVDRITVGVDASDLIARPDPGKDADDAHDRLTISDESYRKRKGFDDSDAPSEEEVQRRLEWQALRRGRAITPSTTPTDGDDETLPDTEPGTDGTDEGRTASALVAAAEGPSDARVGAVGDRLARLDQSLQDRVIAASDAAVRRALERALNRTRNRARRTPHADQLTALTPLRVHEAAPVMEALGITDLDLVTEGDFDELEDQWMTWVAAAQATTVGEYEGLGLELIDTERQRLEAEQDENRSAGWATLLALLLALTRTRLTSADPAGTDETVEETLGEITEGVLVPAGIAREALAVAGGATTGAQTTPGGAVLLDAGTRPAGGVATGVLSLRLAGDTGLTVTGWRWVHGLPTTPFEPHARLDGQVFQSWQDPILAADPAQWPHVAFYVPGDHRGCTCGSAPQLTLTDPASSN